MMGLDPAGFSFVDPDRRGQNMRLKRDAFELRAILNRLNDPKWQRNLLSDAVREVSEQLPDEPEGWQDILGPDDRAAVLNSYTDSNARVATEYLGDAETRLFDRSGLGGSAEARETYPGLRPAVAVELLLRLDRVWAAPGYKRQRRLHQAQDLLARRAPWLRPLLSPRRLLRGRPVWS
jgi:hypothetical protein